MELKVVVREGSLAENRLAPEVIMDAVQATLARMNVKAAISLVEEDPRPAGYEDAPMDDEESDDPGLTELVKWVEEEFGGPVVAIMPSSAIVEPGGETDWVVMGDVRNRSIHWIVAYKSYSVFAGPAAQDCPLAFFELVERGNQEWRQACRAYHASVSR
jgi:hypothetical protein